jgi:mono/diheme cytochrome c family protein
LQERCVVCHSGSAAPSGLRLDSLGSLQQGSANGPVALPGDPAASELVRRIRGDSQPRMPLTGPPYLSDAEIALIEQWVAGGMAPAPAGAGTEAAPPQRRRPSPGEPVTFSDVAPIFLQRCVKCHTDGGLRGAPPEGLRLGSREEILRGGERMVVVPGVAAASELVRRIQGQSRPRMPLDGPPFLSSEEIRLVSDWIAQGAADDQGERAPVPVGARVRLEGRLEARWRLDGLPLVVGPETRIRKDPGPGDRVEVRGTVLPEGAIGAQRIRRR